MKWFKHYTDASFDNKLNRVEDKFGLVGYAVYFKIIEVCAMQWDGKTEPIFDINKKKTKSILSLNYKKTESILSLFSVLNLFSVEIFEEFYRIEIPNLVKIKDNHTKNLQVTGKLVSENLPQEKNRKEKKREEKKKEKKENSPTSKFSDEILDLWNRNCSDFGMPKVKTLGAQRLKKLNTATKVFKDLDDWKKIFNVTANKGFIGKDGREFIPNWDYIFRNENYVKFFEEYEITFEEKPTDQKQLEQNVVNHILSQM